MILNQWGLMIIDLQRYYIDSDASFVRFFESISPGASQYIRQRVQNLILPNLQKVIVKTRQAGRPIIYLRLCGTDPQRQDLHRHFQKCHNQALQQGFIDLYPLAQQSMADILPQIAPQAQDHVIDKTTYSGFTSTLLDQVLSKLKLKQLIMTGLATSQCVETTARDASDRGYQIIHLNDCQADYDQISHEASLFSSGSVCGGHVFSTQEFLGWF